MVETTGPRWGTVLTMPSASSSRRASRIDGRLTPVISHSSRSTRRWPGLNVPDMIASRSFCATIARTVGTSSMRSVDFSSVRRSIGRLRSVPVSLTICRPNWQFRPRETHLPVEVDTRPPAFRPGPLSLRPDRFCERELGRKHRDGDAGLPLHDGHAGADPAALVVELELAERVIL